VRGARGVVVAMAVRCLCSLARCSPMCGEVDGLVNVDGANGGDAGTAEV
jgi:hypothetical protein